MGIKSKNINVQGKARCKLIIVGVCPPKNEKYDYSVEKCTREIKKLFNYSPFKRVIKYSKVRFGSNARKLCFFVTFFSKKYLLVTFLYLGLINEHLKVKIIIYKYHLSFDLQY